MGKQVKTFLDEKSYNEKFDSDVSKLIDNGFSDDDIKLYAEDFKKNYAVKKKEVSQSTSSYTSSNQKLVSEQKNGSSDSQKKLDDLFALKPKSQKSKNSQELDYQKAQKNIPSIVPKEINRRDIVAPTKKDIKITQEAKSYDRNLKIKEAEQTKKSFLEYENNRLLPEDEKLNIEKEAEDEINNNGLLNNVAYYGKKAWNALLPVVSTMTGVSTLNTTNTNPDILAEDKILFKEEQKKKGIKDLTESEINKGAKEIFINRKLNKAQEDRETLLIENLPEETKKDFEIQSQMKYGNLKDKDKLYYVRTESAKRKIEDLNNKIESLIEKNKRNEQLTPEEIDFAKNYEYIAQDFQKEYSENYNLYFNNNQDLQNAEKEFDMLKRSYDDGYNFLNKISLNSGKVALGLAQAENKLSELILGENDDTKKYSQDLSLLQSDIDNTLSSEFSKQTEGLNGLEDGVKYVADVFSTQLPNLALMGLSGGTSRALPLIGATGFGSKMNEMVSSNKSGKTSYTPSQMYAAAFMHGGAEMFETATFGKIANLKRFVGSIGKEKLTRELLKKSITENVKSFTKGQLNEQTEELATFFIQDFADENILGIRKTASEKKEQLKRLIKDTGTLSLLLQGSPHAISYALKPFSNREYTSLLDKNSKEILRLTNELKNIDLTEDEKSIIQESINKVTKKSSDLINDFVNNTVNLSDEDKNKLIELEDKTSKTRAEAKSINSSKNISKDVKQKMLNDLKNEYIKDEELRKKIIEGKTNVLEVVSEDKKNEMKSKALSKLLSEKEGSNEAQFTNDFIEQKAIEIYNNQNKSKDAKTEIPTTQTKSETEVQEQAVSEAKIEQPVVEQTTTDTKEPVTKVNPVPSVSNEITPTENVSPIENVVSPEVANSTQEENKNVDTTVIKEQHDEELNRIEEQITSTEKELEAEKSKNILQRSRTEIKNLEKNIEYLKSLKDLHQNNPIDFYNKKMESDRRYHEERIETDEDYVKFSEQNWGSTKFEDTPFYKESVGAISKLKKTKQNEATPSQDIADDGNIRPSDAVVDQNESTNKRDNQNSVQQSSGLQTDNEQENVKFAKSQISKGILNWNGNISSPRIDLGISWSDIRKGELDIQKGKFNTVPAKRLIDAINNSKNNGGYNYKLGTGTASARTETFLSFEDIERSNNEDNLTDAEIEEAMVNKNKLSQEYDEYFNSLDEETQNEILENYENKPREISENTEGGKSEINVSNEKETTAKNSQEVESNFLDKILDTNEIDNALDFLDSLKLDKNNLKVTLPFLPEVWNAFIEAIKISVKAGNTMRNAINEAKKILKEKGFDVNEVNNVVKAFEEKVNQPNQTFEKKPGKKTLLSRMSEGKDSEVKKAISEYSLDYEVENQEIAQRNAELFVEKVGVKSALKAVRSGEIVGAEKAFVYSKIIDVISNEIQNVPESEVQELEDINLQVLEEISIEFDKESRNAGRFISALQKVYSSSNGRYNLTKQVQSYRARHDGNIPDDILQKFIEADAKIKEYEKKIQELEAEKKIQEEERSFENIVEAIARKNKIDKSKGITNKAKAKAFADKLRSYKSSNRSTLSAATPMSLAVDLAIETAATTIEVSGSIADAIKKGLEAIRNSKINNDEKSEAIQQFLNVFDVEEGATDNIKIDGEGKLKIPHSLIREKVESGIDNIDDLVDVIYDEVLEIYPEEELNKRDVRDAITQYGKIINQTKDEIEIQISLMKSLGKLLSGIEDALDGKRPLRSGLQRRPFTLEEREQKRKLRELLRDLPMDDADVSKAWKTALDTIKSRLKNEIQDLEEQISKGEKRKSEKKQIEYDEEAKGLKDLRDKKREILDNLVGKPELTEEQKIEKAMILVQKKIDELQQNIINSNIAYKTRPNPVTSVRLEELKKQRQDLYAEIEKMRKESGLAEKKRLDLAKKSRIRRIDELKKKIENRDYSKREQKPLPIDEEILDLESKLQEQKVIYEKEKYIDELNNRNKLQKIFSTFIDIIGVTRLLKAGGEFSQVLVQQGFLTPQILLTNPKEFFFAMSKLGKSFISPDSSIRFEQMMKSDPLYPLMMKSKLSLTGTDHKLDAQEENFQLDLISDIWNLIGNKLDKITGNKDVLTLTGLMKTILSKQLNSSDKKTLGTQFKEASFWKMFERAAVNYSNHIKMVKFKQGVTELKKDSKDPINDIEDYKKLANYVNVFSGRASLGKAEFLSKDAALIFFSLRNAVSQIQQLNPYFYLVSLGDANQFKEIKSGKDLKNIKPTVAQKMAVRSFMTSLIAIAGFKTAFMAIANSGEDDDEEKWKLETDPRSSDFGKLRKGKSTFDMWHGLNGLFVLYSRIFTQQTKSIKTGEIKELGKGFGTATTSDLLTRYVTNKFAPTAGYLWRLGNTHEEKDADGKKYRVDKFGNVYGEKEMLDLFIPIYYGSVYQISKEDPDTYQAFLTSLGILGMSIGTDMEGQKFREISTQDKIKSSLKPLNQRK